MFTNNIQTAVLLSKDLRSKDKDLILEDKDKDLWSEDKDNDLHIGPGGSLRTNIQVLV